jgi:hypothetical protein
MTSMASDAMTAMPDGPRLTYKVYIADVGSARRANRLNMTNLGRWREGAKGFLAGIDLNVKYETLALVMNERRLEKQQTFLSIARSWRTGGSSLKA